MIVGRFAFREIIDSLFDLVLAQLEMLGSEAGHWAAVEIADRCGNGTHAIAIPKCRDALYGDKLAWFSGEIRQNDCHYHEGEQVR